METTDKEYFDYLVKRSKLSFLLRKFLYKSIVKEFRGKALDVGCGLGELLELYKNSYGVDSNPFVVEYCKSKKLKCFLGNAYKTPFRNGMFNTVICSHLIEHLDKPSVAFKEFKRVLRKNGLLIIIVPNKKGYQRDKTHVKYWNEKNLTGILKKFNFKIKKVIYFPFSAGFLRETTAINELRVVAIKS